jgi:hypothetical protein
MGVAGVARLFRVLGWRGKRPRHRVLRRVGVGVALVLCALTTGGLVALGLSRSTPRWWTRVEVMDAASVAQAEALEAAALAQASLVRPGARTGARWQSEPWSISLSEADANAWLGERLPRWVQSRADEDGRRGWPEGVRHVRVVFREGAVWLAALVREQEGNEPADTVLSVAVGPTVDASGKLWVEARSVGVGRLTLPPMVLSPARDDPARAPMLPSAIASRPEIAALLDILAGDAPASVEPRLALGDGRRVRLLSIHAREGRLELTCRTEAE